MHSRQHGHSGKPKCVNRCPGRVTLLYVATHPPCNQEYSQSYRVGPGYVTQINRGLGHTKTTKGEYCYVVPDNCIDHQTFESISSIFQAFNIDQQTF